MVDDCKILANVCLGMKMVMTHRESTCSHISQLNDTRNDSGVKLELKEDNHFKA